MNRVSSEFAVVIPAYNEAATISDVAARTLEYVARVIVVDDGSSDGTAEELRTLRITVLRHPRNLGKATALWLGIQHAVDHNATAIITLDGDGQHKPEDIPALIAMHRRDPSAIVIGSRLHNVHEIPMARYVANRIANFWISWAAGQPIDDSQSGFRLYPASVLRTAGVYCDRTAGFIFESEVLIEAGRRGIAIRSVPVSAVYGRHLRESHFRQVRDITLITRMVARKLLARHMDLHGLINSRRRHPARVRPHVFVQSTGRVTRPRRRLILFVAEAVSLAHVARAVALARSLDPDRYEMHLACDPRYLSLFKDLPASVHAIRSIRSEQFQDRLLKGNPLYTTGELRSYVKEDLQLLADLTPDVVVGDFRLSLSVSARIACVPYLTVTNAYWSPYARSRFVVPDLAITDRFGPRLGQALFSLMRPVIFAYHAYALNKVRHDYGLPSVGYSLPHVFMDADETLYADLPELVPTFGRPDNHHYLGPVLWSPDIRLPWWNSLPEDQPIAYVSLGSSGRNDLLALVIQALDALGIRALVSTAGKVPPTDVPNHVWMSDYVPGLKAAERADFVICNGGSATVYQALAAGVPILGIPSNLDQYLMMDYVKRSKAGVYVRAGQASIARLTETARDLVQNLHYRYRAESFKTLIQTEPCGTPLDTILSRYLGIDPSDESLPPVGQTPTHSQDNHRTPLSGMTTHPGRPSHVGSVPLTDRAETEGAPPGP